jgi:hypothetical protein
VKLPALQRAGAIIQVPYIHRAMHCPIGVIDPCHRKECYCPIGVIDPCHRKECYCPIGVIDSCHRKESLGKMNEVTHHICQIVVSLKQIVGPHLRLPER